MNIYYQRFKTVEERFWEKVDIKGPDECWLWKGCINKKWGYGNFSYKGKPELAHRITWMLKHGPIPNGMKICHKCDNPPCCNPSHLFLGTNQDNSDDMCLKGRQPNNVGEKNPHSRLTSVDIVNIRSSVLRVSELAIMYGVDRHHISGIILHKYWKHI